MKAGFIGLGKMGEHMARRILEAGFPLAVHDARGEAAARLLERGAEWAATPREMAATCRAVFSCLPTPQSVEDVVYGANGLKAGWKQGDIYVDMSTNSPSLLRRIARDAGPMGVAVLDAPVSGGTQGAQDGTLAIMAGGDPRALEAVRGILRAMGSRIFMVGGIGCGNVAKLANNLIALACSAATAEGFVLGVKAGIDPRVLWEIVRASTGNNWSLQHYPRTVFQGDFEPGFRIGLAAKDIGLAYALGEECGARLPIGAAVQRGLREAIESGLADKSVNAVILPLENAAGVTVRAPGASGE